MIQENKSITFEYEILDSLEVGIVLKSYEIKQISLKKVNLKGSFAKIVKSEMFIFGVHIPVYENAVFYEKLEETRTRKLLLHKKQIKKWEQEIKVNQHLTIIPKDIYINNGKCKLTLCLCKGKKLHDKRQDLKEKDNARYNERY
jgi:SsrA-binding protein